MQQYSPKFLRILENLEDPENKGLHLIYTQFRKCEGIEILTLILEQNGFSRFKIKKEDGEWILDMTDEEMDSFLEEKYGMMPEEPPVNDSDRGSNIIKFKPRGNKTYH